MKKTIFAFAIVCNVTMNYAQTNTLPNSGNVGIGTTNPTTRLDVNGNVKIDSSLLIKDSLTLIKSARLRDRLTVDGKVIFKDNAVLRKNIKVEGNLNQFGDVYLHQLIDSTYNPYKILTIDATGKVKTEDIIEKMYGPVGPVYSNPCKVDMNNQTIYGNPIWQNGPNKIFVVPSQCIPDPKVGIGLNDPLSKLHIKLNNTTTKPLIIENISGTRLMQLDVSGLLYAREVKVNLDSWPDYVFENNYALLTFDQLRNFIAVNKHLPNVPSANEMLEKGLNISETSVKLLEKIEELTLYMLQLEEKIQQQQKEIELLKKTN